MPYKLTRESDGAGDRGQCSESIQWDENGEFKEVISDRPTVGCSVLVGSYFARTMSNQDYWLTTVVTEIISESDNVVKFKTENGSVYTWESYT